MQPLAVVLKSIGGRLWARGPKVYPQHDVKKSSYLWNSHPQKYSMAHLTLEQRYEISGYLKAGFSRTQVAEKINRDKSVVSREIKRNCDGRSGQYRPDLAHKKTKARVSNKPKKVYFTEEIKSYVIEKLNLDFSPEQIAGEAKKNGVNCVSHERIYQFVWKNKKSGGGLHLHLRSKGKPYGKRGNTNNKRGQITGRVDIDERPKVVEQKERFGDLEIDLVIGKDHKGALLTINDRATGMLKMAIIRSKEAAVIQQKTVELLTIWKPMLFTITSDNGKEFANHAAIAECLEIDYYFAKPYHSWERGANENLNGLIRQYFPKKSDFTAINEERVNEVVNILNNRPRKRFDYLTPYEVFLKKSA